MSWCDEPKEPRPWVVRLGSYLRIFGPPATTPGFGFWTSPDYIDSLIAKDQRREQEFPR